MAGEPAARGDPKARTQEWLRRRFHRYYKGAELQLPDRFARREFGFMFWGGGLMQRHLGFDGAGPLRTFLVSRTPMHVYYSSAYYETPNAPTMDEKGWLGADLVFDLDADHIPGAQAMPYPKMLALVKQKIAHLYDDFLARDFGFDERAMRIVFSGGRGYHIHVVDPRVWGLESHERREIVDFIIGTGLDPSRIFRTSAFDVAEFRGHRRVKQRVVSPAPDAPGWAGKVARAAIELAKRLGALSREEATTFLVSFEGVTAEAAGELLDNLLEVRATRPRPIRGLDRLVEGNIEALTDKNRDLLIRIATQVQQVRVDRIGPIETGGIAARGETDEPVTSDIKRLIRMPSSIHGKTGLMVVPLRRAELDAFDPLRDAVPATWSDAPVRMRFRSALNLEMRGETFAIAEGATAVPEYLAVFAAARGLAAVE